MTPSAHCATADLERLLARQRAAFEAEGVASARVRIDRLDRALELLVSHKHDICDALAADFGQRPAPVTLLMDVFPSVHALRHARRHVRRWMRPRACRVGFPLGLPGAGAEIVYQPLGVVGLISPWNFPITLTFGPLAGILAAGNRCLIKPSEVTPQTAVLLKELIGRCFQEEEIAVVLGGADVAQSFSRLAFDHLLFTGSTAAGRQVMAAAAEHLVPVTLELGGKSPAIIGRSASLRQAVDRIMTGKLANAGQVCLAPDYVCVPAESVDEFVEQARRWVARAYPGVPDNPDYTGLVNTRHACRARDLIADAQAHGGRVVALAEAAVVNPLDDRLMAPVLILDPRDDMRVMQEEVFAPVLPVRTYERIEDAISYVSRHERPLALYYFGYDRAEERRVLAGTLSGGVTVNDVAMHFLAQELPFGGVGASGMGAYHGPHGFQRFSHARAVFRQSRLDAAGLVGLRPPYGRRLRRTLKLLIGR